jgi:RND family efflux transporter MFP subunit
MFTPSSKGMRGLNATMAIRQDPVTAKQIAPACLANTACSPREAPDTPSMPICRVFPIFAASLAMLAAEPSPVTVETAVLAPVATRLELTGSVSARHRSRLSSRASGLIRTMHVDAGDLVKQGDLLMDLDPELAELELDRMDGELEQARIELADAERLFTEARALTSRGAFPKSEADSRKSAVDVKNATVRQLEARSKQQRAVIERHRLVAPYDGVISRRLADAGEWVETGTPVVELVSLDRPRLDVQVPQEYYAKLAGESKVTVKLDAFPNREFAGQVVATVPVKDPVARTFLTRVEWEDQGVSAGPGMSGKAVFEFESDDSVVQVPRDAVVRFPDGTTKVWTLRDEGGRTIAAPRNVTLGGSLAGNARVTSGLEEGARVVVRGNESLQEGQEVTVLPAVSEPGTP